MEDFANLPPGNWTKSPMDHPTLHMGDIRVRIYKRLELTSNFESDEDYDDVRLELKFHLCLWQHPLDGDCIYRSSSSLHHLLEEIGSAMVEMHTRDDEVHPFPKDMPDWLKTSIASKLREVSDEKMKTADSMERAAMKDRLKARNILNAAHRLMGYSIRGG